MHQGKHVGSVLAPGAFWDMSSALPRMWMVLQIPEQASNQPAQVNTAIFMCCRAFSDSCSSQPYQKIVQCLTRTGERTFVWILICLIRTRRRRRPRLPQRRPGRPRTATRAPRLIRRWAETSTCAATTTATRTATSSGSLPLVAHLGASSHPLFRVHPLQYSRRRFHPSSRLCRNLSVCSSA